MNIIEVFGRSDSTFVRHESTDGSISFARFGNGVFGSEAGEILAKRIGLTDYKIVEVE